VSGFPRMLLQHQVVVRPFVSWGVWAGPVTVRCLVDEGLSQRVGRDRLQVRETARIFAPIEWAGTIRTWSKVDLPDGRQGYAAGVARKTAGSLPVPEHLEIVWDGTSGAVSPAGGESVTVRRRVPTAERDEYNQTVHAWSARSVAGCRVELSSSEDSGDGSRVTVTGTVLMPGGERVSSRDRLVVRGRTYGVDGEPERVDDDTTGEAVGLRVSIRRVVGAAG